MAGIMKAIKAEGIIDLIQDSETRRPIEAKRTFEYNLNEKATKNKLVKGAKRIPFEVVENSLSSNLVFSLGAWDQVVLSTIRYWNQVNL